MRPQSLARLRALMVVTMVASSTCAAVAQPVFQRLGELPGGPFGSAAIGVSADGHTVVGVGNWNRRSGASQAFRWTAEGGMVGLGMLPGDNFSLGQRASATGEFAVGDSGSDATGRRQAVRWSASGEILGLGDFPGGGVDSWAVAVSRDGSTAAGTGTNANGFQAFRWRSDTGLSSLGSLGQSRVTLTGGMSADGRVITGIDQSPTVFEAFLWTENGGMRGLGDLPGGRGLFSAGTDISPDGRIVVGFGEGAAGSEAMM